MKKILVILFILNSFSTFSQKMPSDYFEEAIIYFEEEEFDKAIEVFQFIVENYPKNLLYPRAFYNVGYIYFIKKDYNKAISVFTAIIESNFNEKENLNASIMEDPYTNYKHRASNILSNIYYDKKMFDTALHYLALSDTVFPYLHFCGNEYEANYVYVALRYADIYQKLNQPNKAIEKLLPTVFVSLVDNSKVITELKILFKNKKGLKKELDNSLKKIYPKTIQLDNYTYIRYYFKFLNVEITVPDSYEIDEKNFNINKAINIIRQTDFYKMIEQL